MNAPSVAVRPSPPPPGLLAHRTTDLKHGRSAVAVQVVFAVVAAAAVGLALTSDLPLAGGWGAVTTWLVTLALCGVYMVLHELTHGAALRLLSDSGASFSVRFPYLSTGSDACLTKARFVAVALAPMVVCGAVLLVALLTVPAAWFLTLYVLTALNLAGSAGDLVQVATVARIPAGALVRDDGSETTVYLPA
ncbi:DUF3267 domain-containing protein [Jannaschia sp. R86511]|uniref:DUF3267 domain-containing protein n=1 Tax=Jannaschia sp. R86511 TaxID=3093853 RepID=UPI0036D31965